MLVLARKPHETIVIGDQITISIVSVRGRVVRLGIEAPGEIRVVRGELRGDAAAAPADANASPDPAAGASGEAQAKSVPVESFTPSPRLSTAYVNRVLSQRRQLVPAGLAVVGGS